MWNIIIFYTSTIFIGVTLLGDFIAYRTFKLKDTYGKIKLIRNIGKGNVALILVKDNYYCIPVYFGDYEGKTITLCINDEFAVRKKYLISKNAVVILPLWAILF